VYEKYLDDCRDFRREAQAEQDRELTRLREIVRKLARWDELARLGQYGLLAAEIRKAAKAAEEK
jgi:hypothetical protein